MAEKRSTATLVTTFLGAAVNIVGNALLIPIWGAMGAAIATCFSYMIIFISRAVHAQRLLKVRWSVVRFIISMALLIFQCYWMEQEAILPALFCCIGVLLLYFRPLIKAVKSGVFAMLHANPNEDA